MPRSFSGRALRDARRAAGLRPEHVAIAVHRSVYSIHEYETERVTPSLPVAVALADLLGCSVDDLLREGLADVA